MKTIIMRDINIGIIDTYYRFDFQHKNNHYTRKLLIALLAIIIAVPISSVKAQSSFLAQNVYQDNNISVSEKYATTDTEATVFKLHPNTIATTLECNDQISSPVANPQNPLGVCEGRVWLQARVSDISDCIEDNWVDCQVFFDLWSDGTIDRIGSSSVSQQYKEWNSVPRFDNGLLNPAWISLQSEYPEFKLEDLVYVVYVKPAKVSGEVVNLPPFMLFNDNIDHKAIWKITDGCGNVDQCQSTVIVVDKKVPTPYCVHKITAVMQTNPEMVELRAKDLDKGAFDNCSPENKLYFTFEKIYPVFSRLNEEHYFKGQDDSKAGVDATEKEFKQGLAQKWIPTIRCSSKIWTSTGLSNIKVSVWDEAWNTDYCEVELMVWPGGCSFPGYISGTVATATGEQVSDAKVTLEANHSEYPISVLTNTNGIYLAGNPVSLDYTISASKGGDFLNGVTTLDLVFIQRHILGMELLNSNYKVIAADANNDGRITVQDLSELRKLILGVTPRIANESWRFPVTGTPVYTNPLGFSEVINVYYLIEDVNGQDFVAVKIGDVNGSVDLSARSGSVEARSNERVSLSISEATLEAGELVEIPVRASDYTNVVGFQFTMNLNGAVYAGIENGALDITEEHIGDLGNGIVTMSFTSPEQVTLNDDEVLFTMKVRAEKTSVASEIFSLGSKVTKAESYNGNLEVGGVNLKILNTPVSRIELFQNEPNPYKGQTTVSFTMPAAGAATLSVYDMTGKQVVVREIAAVKGMNREIITKDQLGVSGILYYTLMSGDFTATKKMIIME